MEEKSKKNKKALSFIAKAVGNLGMSMFFERAFKIPCQLHLVT